MTRTPLEDFVRDYVESAGGDWDEVEPQVYDLLIPRRQASRHFEAEALRITFDPEAVPEHPGSQLASYGTPLIDRLLQDAVEAGQENWKTLRAYLGANLAAIQVKPRPEWVNVIAAHDRLFGDDPCATYAAASLDGDTEQLKRVYNAVNIPDGSWFPRELFYEQIRTAARRSHTAFRSHLDRLLEVVEGTVALRHS